jgi:hypothetical protein
VLHCEIEERKMREDPPLRVRKKNWGKWYWKVNDIGMVHALILLIVCIYKRGIVALIIPSVFMLVYYVVIIANREKTKRWLELQRKWLSHFRQTCAEHFGLSKLNEIGIDDWEKHQGWRSGCRLYILLMANTTISFFWEGKVAAAFSVVPAIVYFFAADRVGSRDFIETTVRINAVHQFLTGMIWSNMFTDIAARRATLTRIFCAYGCFESIEELFVQIVVLMTLLCMVIFGPQSASIFLSLKCFVFIIIPSELVGLRYILVRSLSVNTFKLTEGRRLALVACFIPTTIVYRAYLTESQLFSVDNLIIFVNAVMAIFCYVKQDYLTAMVQGSFVANNGYGNKTKPGAELRWTFYLFAMFCFVHRFTLEAILIVGLGTIVDTKKVQFKRKVLLLLQVLLFLHPHMRENGQLMVMLASARVELALVCAPFGEVAWQSFFSSTLQLSLAPAATRGAIGMISWCTTVLTLAVAIMEENAFRLIDVAKQADSFLDHAIKQKFSSVGAAVCHALEIDSKTMDPATRLSLTKALQECRSGQNACYISSFAIQYQAGVRRPLFKQTRELLTVLDLWTTESEFPQGCRVSIINKSDFVELEVDWDLLKALLFEMCTDSCRDDNSVMIKITSTDDSSACLITVEHENDLKAARTKFDSAHSKITRNIRETIARALGGEMIARNTLMLSLKTSGSMRDAFVQETNDPKNSKENQNREPKDQPILWNTESCSQLQLPSNLTVAAIDDSSLVRKSLTHLIVKHLHASQDAMLITGATEMQAQQFPNDLIERNVDIAIFDENLDYDTERVIKGTDLAVQARELGFSKCCILHSANNSLANDLHSAFDGFVEKTSSKDRFVREVARIWHEYRYNRKNLS